MDYMNSRLSIAKITTHELKEMGIRGVSITRIFYPALRKYNRDNRRLLLDEERYDARLFKDAR